MALSSNSVVLPQVPRIEPQNFVEGVDVAGTLKTIFTPGANGSKVVGVVATSRDNALAHTVLLYLTRSGTDYLLGTVSVAAEAGHNGAVPGADIMDPAMNPGLPLDADGQPYILLEPDDLLKATFGTGLTSGKRMDLVTVGADF